MTKISNFIGDCEVERRADKQLSKNLVFTSSFEVDVNASNLPCAVVIRHNGRMLIAMISTMAPPHRMHRMRSVAFPELSSICMSSKVRDVKGCVRPCGDARCEGKAGRWRAPFTAHVMDANNVWCRQVVRVDPKQCAALSPRNGFDSRIQRKGPSCLLKRGQVECVVWRVS